MSLDLSSRPGFAQALLAEFGLPQSKANVSNLVSWETIEGGGFGNEAAFNPLNTTYAENGASAINSVGVKAYQNADQGFVATVDTLQEYPTVLAALKKGNLSVQQFANVVAATTWGTQSSGWPNESVQPSSPVTSAEVAKATGGSTVAGVQKSTTLSTKPTGVLGAVEGIPAAIGGALGTAFTGLWNDIAGSALKALLFVAFVLLGTGLVYSAVKPQGSGSSHFLPVPV